MNAFVVGVGAAVVLFLGGTGCQEPQAGGARAGAASDPTAGAPSFRRDVAPVLERSCAGARGCHGAAPTDGVALDLRPGAAHGELVGKAAEMRRGSRRVEPGDPAASFLIAKVAGNVARGEGKAMPLDPNTGWPVHAGSPRALDPAFVATVLTPWIKAGAPNN